MQAVALRVLQVLITSLLTEKMIINLTLLILGKVVQSTENDLDDQIFKEVKTALDNNHGTPKNLYKEVKEKT